MYMSRKKKQILGKLLPRLLEAVLSSIMVPTYMLKVANRSLTD